MNYTSLLLPIMSPGPPGLALKCAMTMNIKTASFLAKADEKEYCIRSKANMSLILQMFRYHLVFCSIPQVFFSSIHLTEPYIYSKRSIFETGFMASENSCATKLKKLFIFFRHRVFMCGFLVSDGSKNIVGIHSKMPWHTRKQDYQILKKVKKMLCIPQKQHNIFLGEGPLQMSQAKSLEKQQKTLLTSSGPNLQYRTFSPQEGLSMLSIEYSQALPLFSWCCIICTFFSYYIYTLLASYTQSLRQEWLHHSQTFTSPSLRPSASYLLSFPQLPYIGLSLTL